MNVCILAFGKINFINSHIAEIIINDGITLGKEEVRYCHRVLRSNLEPPFSVLIHKENAYSYTFEAQLEMGMHSDILLRAIVVYHHNAEMAAKIIMNLNKNKNWNIEIFRERQSALDWLHTHINNRTAV
jgi:hypothetical protein